MESLEGDGLFWLAHQPQNRVAGHFRFDPIEGAKVELIGSFEGLESSMQRETVSKRILGIAAGQYLTLDGCYRGTTSLDGVGLQREEWIPSVVLTGAHWESEELIEFTDVSVSFDELPAWGALPRMLVTPTKSQGSGPIDGISLGVTKFPSQEVK